MLALQGTSAGAADLAATARVAFLVFVLPLPLFASLAVMVSRRAGWRALLVLWAVVVLGLIGTAAVRTLTSPVLRSRTAPIGGAFGLSLGILLYYGLAFGSGAFVAWRLGGGPAARRAGWIHTIGTLAATILGAVAALLAGVLLDVASLTT